GKKGDYEPIRLRTGTGKREKSAAGGTNAAPYPGRNGRTVPHLGTRETIAPIDRGGSAFLDHPLWSSGNGKNHLGQSDRQYESGPFRTIKSCHRRSRGYPPPDPGGQRTPRNV